MNERNDGTALQSAEVASERKAWKLGVLFAFSFFTTLLFLSMRGIQALGGYVSSGGPYLVTRPAPAWTWIMAPTILLTIVSMIFGFNILKKERAFYLMSFSFSALFISLGWNFIDFGLGLGGKPGPFWYDLVVGTVFVLIGSIPFLVSYSEHRLRVREKRRKERFQTGALPVWMQTLTALSSVFLAVLLFRLLQ